MATLTPFDLALGLLILVVAIGLIFAFVRNRRRAHLRARYGNEYDLAVRRFGSSSRAEADFLAREKRVAGLDLRRLTILQREDFIRVWQRIQTQFVDDPAGAVAYADILLSDVMIARGYPVENFDDRADDLSVDHPDVVQNYRIAHGIALRQSREDATTEDLRQAMIHYRTLFDELVNEPGVTSLADIEPRPLRARP